MTAASLMAAVLNAAALVDRVGFDVAVTSTAAGYVVTVTTPRGNAVLGPFPPGTLDSSPIASQLTDPVQIRGLLLSQTPALF